VLCEKPSRELAGKLHNCGWSGRALGQQHPQSTAANFVGSKRADPTGKMERLARFSLDRPGQTLVQRQCCFTRPPRSWCRCLHHRFAGSQNQFSQVVESGCLNKRSYDGVPSSGVTIHVFPAMADSNNSSRISLTRKLKANLEAEAII
jgi:hypothetical protein